MPKIEVQATANVTGATTGLQKVQSELAKTAVAAQKSDSVISKAGTSLGTNLKAGANQATNALTNFGRIVQDAPFGIIGITNNINPLLESFQRLKAESGSTSGALKALGGSLVGAGGLGLAVSVATSLLTIFALQTRSVGEETEKANSKFKSYVDSIKSAAGEVAKESTEVLGLIGILKSEVETRDRKLAAIKQLQDIQPEIFRNLKLEGNAVVGLDNSYKAYLATLQNVIEVKTLQAQLEEKIERQLLLQRSIITDNKPLSQQKLLTDAQVEAAKAAKQLADNTKLLGLGITRLQGQKELNQLTEDIDILGKRLFDLSKSVKVSGLKFKIDKPEFEFERPGAPIFQPGKVGLPQAPIKISIPVLPEINFIPNTEQQRRALKEFLDNIKAEEVGARVSQILTDSINTGLSGIADSFANILNGTKNAFSGLFDGLAGTLADGLKSIGQYLVKTYLLIGVIEKIKFSNPAVGVAVGFALQVLGALIKSKVQSTKAFATGVRNFEGGFATVGERGPETVFLPRGSSVQPNNEVAAYGGMGITLLPSIRYDGDGFRIMLNRVDQRWGRNN